MDLTPETIYALRERDPAALARLLAAYDAAGIAALSQQCAAFIAACDGVVFPAPLVRSAWWRAGLISAEQAGGAAALVGEGCHGPA